MTDELSVIQIIMMYPTDTTVGQYDGPVRMRAASIHRKEIVQLTWPHLLLLDDRRDISGIRVLAQRTALVGLGVVVERELDVGGGHDWGGRKER